MIPPSWLDTGIIVAFGIEWKGHVRAANIVQALAKRMVRQQAEEIFGQPISLRKTARGRPINKCILQEKKKGLEVLFVEKISGNYQKKQITLADTYIVLVRWHLIISTIVKECTSIRWLHIIFSMITNKHILKTRPFPASLKIHVYTKWISTASLEM